MKRQDLEILKQGVPCATLLGKAGFAVDAQESTRRAVKWRRDAEIIIVTHEGRGWFDPLSDAKGDVLRSRPILMVEISGMRWQRWPTWSVMMR